MDSLRLNCFGVGDGLADSARNRSSFFYQWKGSSFILDCGEPLSRSFQACGAGPESFDRIIISHLHSDHIAGFFMFIQGLWLQGRTKPLVVHLPADAIQPIRQMLDAVYLFADVLPFSLTFEPHQDAKSISFQEVTLTPYRTTHLDRTKAKHNARHPGNYDAFCFLVQSARLRIGHSADLGSPTDLAPLLTQELDLLVCELAHFTPEELFSFLKGRKIRKLALVHLSWELWSAKEDLLKLARASLPNVEIIIIPTDNQEVHVDSKGVSALS
ncbi:MAG TPA: MBL fold metallo-hydrolase [Candidatus Saccharimonadales bacterium]|nr:MBL fold metallo-hydrolase [Candidatus Saccharimonadales bacterium]